MDEFDPIGILEGLSSKFDPSSFDAIDESDFPRASNFLEWVIDPRFLNTSILPKQVEIGAKLFADYCPRCSNKGYIDTLYDQSMGNIRDNIVFLNSGVCPDCKVNRGELISKRELIQHTELVGCLGQRCIPTTSWVYTSRGLIQMGSVVEGDRLSHGSVLEKVDSGVLPATKLKTTYDYELIGATETHIVGVVGKNNALEFKRLKDIKIGDAVLLHSPDLWPTDPFELGAFEHIKHPSGHVTKEFKFPTKVTPHLARLLGHLVSNGQFTREYNFRIISSKQEIAEDIILCCESVFGEKPQLEETRECKSDQHEYKCWTMNGVAIMKWLSFIGLPPEHARTKYIPACILQSPREIVCEFLRGLFSGDGNVYADGSSTRINYCSTSKTLIDQVRLLLLNLGIICRLDVSEVSDYGITNKRTKTPEEGKQVYNIYIKDSKFVAKFYTCIPPIQKKLRDLLSKSFDKHFTYYYNSEGRFRGVPAEKAFKPITDAGFFPVRVVSISECEPVAMADVSIPDTNAYVADGFFHHNSGKTKLVGLVSSFVTHLFLKIPNPLRHFNQPSGEILVGTFSALTLEQAQQTLWESFYGFISASPWFQNYHAFLKEEEKRLSIELYHQLKNSTFYPHKRMLWHCTGSQDRKMRGKTRIFAAIDELGWFISDENKKDLQNMNADGVYTSLSNSLTTMRIKASQLWKRGDFTVPPIIMANVSSPSAAKDKIMRLLKAANTNSKILAFNLPSWESNPDLTFETLREEFAHMDDVTFYRDFGAQPPLSSEPYFTDHKALERIAVVDRFDKIMVTPYRSDDGQGDAFKSAIAKVINNDRSVPRMITFDLGTTKNSLAACLFSLSPDMRIKLDFAYVVIPEKKTRANIAHFFDNFTSPLVHGLNIKHAFFDRWQSLDQVERLKTMGVDARVHSLSYKELDSVRGAITTGGVLIPKLDKPVSEIIKEYVDSDTFLPQSSSALVVQILTVRDVGHRVSKPLEGDDDIFRAFCLGVVKMSDPNIKKLYQAGPSTLKTGHAVQALGVVRGYREGGGGYSGPVGATDKVLGIVRTRRGG